jgi:hypothetical protein
MVWLFSEGARWRTGMKLTEGNNVALTKFAILDRGYTGHGAERKETARWAVLVKEPEGA